MEIALLVKIVERINNLKDESVSFRFTKGPRHALETVIGEGGTNRAKSEWCARARVAAILGSYSHSLPSVKSGCRCYFAFAEKVLGKPPDTALPPNNPT